MLNRITAAFARVSPRARRIISVVSTILVFVLVGLLFGNALASNWQQVADQNLTPNLDMLVAVILFAVAVPISGLLWGRIVNKLEPEPRVTWRESAAVHSLSWLLRYVPGKVGTLLSKVVWGTRTGRSRLLVLITFIYENVFLQIASLVPSVIILIVALGITAFEANAVTIALPILLVVIGVVVVMQPRIFHAIMSLATRWITKSELPTRYFLSVSATVELSFAFLVPRLINGVAFVFVATSFLDVTPGMWLPLAAAFTLGSAIGILALFAPGGLGVREAVIFAFAVQLFDPAEAVLLSLLARLLGTVADVLVGVFYLALRPRPVAARPVG